MVCHCCYICTVHEFSFRGMKRYIMQWFNLHCLTMKHQRCRCLGGMQPFHIHYITLQACRISWHTQQSCSIDNITPCTIVVILLLMQRSMHKKIIINVCITCLLCAYQCHAPPPSTGQVGDSRGFAQTVSQKPQGGAKLAMQFPY